MGGFDYCSVLFCRFGEFLYAQLSLRSTAADNVFLSLENDARIYNQLDSVNRAKLLDRVCLQIMMYLECRFIHFATVLNFVDHFVPQITFFFF